MTNLHHDPALTLPASLPDIVAEASRACCSYLGARARLIHAACGDLDHPARLAATAWLCSPDLTRVLLIRTQDHDWAMPAELVHLYESPLAAAIHSVEVDLGLTLTPVLPDPAAVSWRTGEEEVFCLAYLFLLDESTPLAPSESTDPRWFDLRTAPLQGSPPARAHIQRALTALAPRLPLD